MDISLISIVNNDEVFNSFKRNLRTQKDIKYELIKVNNQNNQFDSARAALNKGAKKSHSKYLAFVHPDVRFTNEYALRNIFDYVSGVGDFGVIGVAGCKEGRKNYILTNIIQGKNAERIGTRISDVCKVQTVDECFFIEKRSFFLKMPFSEKKGWHFYAVEQCLRSIIAGKSNYVIPAELWHLSPGDSENIEYVRMGFNLVKKYGRYFEPINTTVEKWSTRGAKKYYMPWLFFVMHKAKKKIRKHPRLYYEVQKIYFKAVK